MKKNKKDSRKKFDTKRTQFFNKAKGYPCKRVAFHRKVGKKS